MKQPDLADIGTQMDVVKYRLMAAKDDLDTAKLTFQAGKFRAANNRAYYMVFFTRSALCLQKRESKYKLQNSFFVWLRSIWRNDFESFTIFCACQ